MCPLTVICLFCGGCRCHGWWELVSEARESPVNFDNGNGPSSVGVFVVFGLANVGTAVLELGTGNFQPSSVVDSGSPGGQPFAVHSGPVDVGSDVALVTTLYDNVPTSVHHLSLWINLEVDHFCVTCDKMPEFVPAPKRQRTVGQATPRGRQL